jgi:hypothetical protein
MSLDEWGERRMSLWHGEIELNTGETAIVCLQGMFWVSKVTSRISGYLMQNLAMS